MNDENKEVDINKKNREDYEELIKESSTKKDMYWDKNDPAVKMILLFIGIIIIVGSAYFIIKYIIR
jgi:hypothetical protein